MQSVDHMCFLFRLVLIAALIHMQMCLSSGWGLHSTCLQILEEKI